MPVCLLCSLQNFTSNSTKKALHSLTALHFALQALVEPSVVILNANDTMVPETISVRLHAAPSGSVVVNISIPGDWQGSPLADVEPPSLNFDPSNWQDPQQVVYTPRQTSNGNYHATFAFK